MKIFISADIEGVAGVASWDETSMSKPDFLPFAQQMTKEVASACEGAISAGADEIWIKDAHGQGRNIDFTRLPQITRMIRSWSGHPFLMMQELDASFDAAMFTGYHSFGGSEGNPLAHTFINSNISFMKLNDEYASEFLINAYTASYMNVPVVFISGDEGICCCANELNGNMKSVAVKKGVGNSVISIHPDLAASRIREGVQSALAGNFDKCKIKLPGKFKIEISYIQHYRAYKASFYPGIRQVTANNVMFEADDYFEVLRTLLFILYA